MLDEQAREASHALPVTADLRSGPATVTPTRPIRRVVLAAAVVAVSVGAVLAFRRPSTTPAGRPGRHSRSPRRNSDLSSAELLITSSYRRLPA